MSLIAVTSHSLYFLINVCPYVEHADVSHQAKWAYSAPGVQFSTSKPEHLSFISDNGLRTHYPFSHLLFPLLSKPLISGPVDFHIYSIPLLQFVIVSCSSFLTWSCPAPGIYFFKLSLLDLFTSDFFKQYYLSECQLPAIYIPTSSNIPAGLYWILAQLFYFNSLILPLFYCMLPGSIF